MKDGIRVVLVDPSRASRQSLVQQLETIDSLWLTEVCVSYRIAPGRVAEIRPDLTIVVADAEPERAAEAIGTIVREEPEALVLAASRSTDSNVVLSLVRNGARELLTLPVESGDLLRAVKRVSKREDDSPAQVEGGPKSKVIAVTGATGEAGCTSVVVNLATTLAKSSGQETALVDFELMFGGIDTALDLVPEYTLADVVRTLDRIDLTLLRRMLCRHSSGLYVLPRPIELREAATLDPERLGQTISLLREAFPTILVDTSKSLQTSDFAAFELAETILIVVQLDPPSVRNTARLLHCFRGFDGYEKRVRLVANRVGSLRSTVPVEEAEAAFGMPISWQIPNATKVYHPARDRGVPIDVISARCDAQRVFAEIARALVPPKALPKPARPQRGFFRDRFSREA